MVSFPHAEFGPNDHQENAPHFTKNMIPSNLDNSGFLFDDVSLHDFHDFLGSRIDCRIWISWIRTRRWWLDFILWSHCRTRYQLYEADCHSWSSKRSDYGGFSRRQKNLASAFHVSWQLLNGSPPILAISDIPILRGGSSFDPFWIVEEISHGIGDKNIDSLVLKYRHIFTCYFVTPDKIHF